MEPVTPEILTAFLKRLGEIYPNQTTFYLLGGSALLLLGNPRQTLDVDYTTNLDPEQKRELEDNLKQLSAQFRLDIEAVPLKSLSQSLLAPKTAAGSSGVMEISMYISTIFTQLLSVKLREGLIQIWKMLFFSLRMG